MISSREKKIFSAPGGGAVGGINIHKKNNTIASSSSATHTTTTTTATTGGSGRRKAAGVASPPPPRRKRSNRPLQGNKTAASAAATRDTYIVLLSFVAIGIFFLVTLRLSTNLERYNPYDSNVAHRMSSSRLSSSFSSSSSSIHGGAGELDAWADVAKKREMILRHRKDRNTRGHRRHRRGSNNNNNDEEEESFLQDNVSFVTSYKLVTQDANQIHFLYLGLWGGSNMPKNFQRNYNRWRHENSNNNNNNNNNNDQDVVVVKVNLWNNDQVVAMIQEFFPPQVLETYTVMAPVQKADFARLLILYHYGGWYFDLDTGINCDQKGIQYASMMADFSSGVDVSSICQNNLEEFKNNMGLTTQQQQQQHEGALFWERGPLDEFEQEISKATTCRKGLAEYPTRLSNYAIFCRPQCALLRRTIALAMSRIARMANSGTKCEIEVEFEGWEERDEYDVLWSSGPDVISEAVFGVRDADETYVSVMHSLGDPTMTKIMASAAGTADATTATAKAISFSREERFVPDDFWRRVQNFQGTTTDGILVKDPGPMLFNANTFSWRGSDNEALESSILKEREKKRATMSWEQRPG